MIRKYDLSYPAAKVAVEYDGSVHVRASRGSGRRTLRGASRSTTTGWRILPVVGSGICNARAHLAPYPPGAPGARVPGVPPRLADEWRAHFPGHADAA